jgi:hypothetical protein
MRAISRQYTVDSKQACSVQSQWVHSQLSEGPSMKSFNCPISGVVGQCLQYFSVSHSFI